MLPCVGMLPITKRSDGGIFQYSQMVLAALVQGLDEGRFGRLVIFIQDLDEVEPDLLPRHDKVSVVPLCEPTPRSKFRRLLAGALGARGRAFLRRFIPARTATPTPLAEETRGNTYGIDMRLHQRLTSFGVDLMIYASPVSMAFEAGVAFVVAVHDLQHRLQREFEEVSAGGIFEQREYTFGNCCRHAKAILVDSETGKEDVIDCYAKLGVEAGRIHPLPFVLPPAHERRLAADYPLDLTSLGIPERFLYYPAQFWSHKNHRGLVRALNILRQEYYLDIPLVLVGSNNGSLKQRCYQEFMAEAEAGAIASNIHYLGYVSDDVLYGLYRKARALVMMTFFGPTNIPVIEAWASGCAVVTSDLRGIREQCGDAALLADPRDPAAIARAIHTVWQDDGRVERLRANGYRRLQDLRPEGFRRRLNDIVAAAAEEAAMEKNHQAHRHERIDP